jgi:excinuclease ABC subunit C
MDGTAVRTRAGDVPREPGVYQFLSDDDAVLYVGKAVELRDRVRSYADPRSARIGRMVERAASIDVAVTDTETQALLLEANLIKRHQPRYNVRLKDDKSYPLVQLTDHEFPRIEITRDPDESATVYGPYTDKGRVEVVLKALRETYGVRGCSDHKFSNRDRPCLDYDIGLCTAPCTGEIGESDYLADVESVARFFEGETGVLADPLRRAMEGASQEQNFERAANLRDRLEAVEAFHEGASAAVSGPDDAEHAVDVLGVAVEGERATVARLRSEHGQLVDRERHTLDAPDSQEPVARVLSAFVPQYYAERELPDALLLPERPDGDEVEAWLEREGVAVRVPGTGREATLVDLALKNARRAVGGRDAGSDLGDALATAYPGLGRVDRIEGFDVSHAQGKAVVGSNVTFVGGSPEKSDYRRKKLTERNDDYGNMRDLIGWRATRAIEGRDDRPDPDLLLIDGGEGQLEAAREALDEAGWSIPAVGLAKREERVVTPDGSLDWPTDAAHLHLLQRVRDEAHRFAVQYHQQVRDEVRTVLDDVPGIGPATRRRLLRRFGSVENVRGASVEDLTSVEGVGAKTAETLARRL